MSMLEKNNFIACFIMFGLVCVGLLFSLVACEQAPPPPPPTKVERTEPPPPKTPEKVEEGEASEEVKKPEYEYDSSGRREPFASLVEEEIDDAAAVILPPDLLSLKTPLQKFEIKTLKVVGIILGSLGDYARVEAPDGKSYTINAGTRVGMHDGSVISVSENSVVVREIIRYEGGKVEELETPLYLNPIEEEEN